MNNSVFHPGEQAAQARFAQGEADPVRLAGIIKPALSESMAAFIAAQGFFFLATADAEGRCDCSYRGSEADSEGRLLPAAWVADPQRLTFPDYAGNLMFNSLGNLLANPNLGLIFIDFDGMKRLRVNGHAQILEQGGDWRARWPLAERAVEVRVEQAFWNCSKRISTHHAGEPI